MRKKIEPNQLDIAIGEMLAMEGYEPDERARKIAQCLATARNDGRLNVLHDLAKRLMKEAKSP
jgi:hypothetical protein